MQLRSIRMDLGIRQLFPVWKQLLSGKYLLSDLYAGITLAFIAIHCRLRCVGIGCRQRWV